MSGLSVSSLALAVPCADSRDASRRLPPLRGGFYLRILGYFRQDLRLIGLLVVMIWIALAAGALGPAVIAFLTDTILTGKPADNAFMRHLLAILPATQAGRVVMLVMLWFVLQAINDTMTLLREMANNQLRYNGTARVRRQLFDHLQELSPTYHKSRPQGDSIYRLSIDAQGPFGVLNTLIGAANSLLTLGVIGAVMMGWNWRMTAVALGLAPLLVLANRFFGRTIRHTSLVSKSADADLTTFIQRAMSSIGLIQLFGRQHEESSRYQQAIDRSIGAGMRMNWQQQLYPLSQRVVYAIGYAFILGYGAHLVRVDQMRGAAQPFTVGGIFAMTYYLGQLWEPMRRITGFTADVQNDAAACARVFAVLDERPAVRDLHSARPLSPRPRTLELRSVHFGYGPDQPILRGIDARIEPGQIVAFIGSSGAGKSTLLNLLSRFYDPQSGAITLDGVDLRHLRLADVRRHIAMVPQDRSIIAGTVAENIAFGNADATLQQIRNAAELAGAAPFIEALPAGYDTQLTENGQNLSGGQCQRLAIARALLSEAPILVLDEPTSGLDPVHERRILDTLLALRGRRTVILVTHRLESVQTCDHIYLLQQGQIIEQGNHHHLLRQSGPYAALWSRRRQPGIERLVNRIIAPAPTVYSDE